MRNIITVKSPDKIGKNTISPTTEVSSNVSLMFYKIFPNSKYFTLYSILAF